MGTPLAVAMITLFRSTVTVTVPVRPLNGVDPWNKPAVAWNVSGVLEPI